MSGTEVLSLLLEKPSSSLWINAEETTVTVVYSRSQGSSEATASAGVAEPCAGTWTNAQSRARLKGMAHGFLLPTLPPALGLLAALLAGWHSWLLRWWTSPAAWRAGSHRRPGPASWVGLTLLAWLFPAIFCTQLTRAPCQTWKSSLTPRCGHGGHHRWFQQQ